MNANQLEATAEMLLARINCGEMELELDDFQVGVPKEAAHWKLWEWVSDLHWDGDTAEEVAIVLNTLQTERLTYGLSAPERDSDAKLTMWLKQSHIHPRDTGLGVFFD